MTAIATERDTTRRLGNFSAHGVLAAARVLAGTMVALTAAGYAQGGATALNLKCVGMADATADNTAGASGDIKVTARRDGWFRFANSAAGDLITIADTGNSCYMVDNQTVAKTDGGATRSVAGKIRDIDAGGVYIEFL